ncbi:MAG: hypothetical protein HFI09_03505 [Bacilli bacterium]|nr:hypothetical protein [Bacilli bacterium]
MRIRPLRFDIWLCLTLGFLLGLGFGKIAEKILPQKYEEYKEEHKVNKGEIGGIADSSVFRAQNVEDLLTHETFTVISKGIQYKNRGAGYYKGMYLYALTLPSGELVAARINSDSVTFDDESIYSSQATLPVGQIIKADLKEEKYFIDQIEYKEKLSRTDFYIDMVGGAEIMSSEAFIDTPIIIIELLTTLIAFPIIHAIGSRFGIFPYFFEPKER